MADKFLCPLEGCRKPVAVTTANKFRSHKDAGGQPCDASGTVVSAAQLAKGPMSEAELRQPDVPVEGRDYGTCWHCTRKVQLNADGLLLKHFTQIGGTVICDGLEPVTPSADTPTVPSADPALSATDRGPSNGDTTGSSVPLSTETYWSYATGMRLMETVELPTAPTSVTSTLTEPSTTPSGEGRQPTASPPPSSLSVPVFAQRGSVIDTEFSAPGAGTAPTLLFAQPGRPKADDVVHSMEPDAAEIATSLRQLFFHYGNRRADDNRNNQKHLGPSEIGTPCDRRLVMSLLGLPTSNPGGDGWAAFVGTAGHASLASMFQWADAGSGRYSVETPLHFRSKHVPRGTGDLLDRATRTFIDHKFMGEWSLKKFRRQGPSAVYRTQIHTYAYGARQRGEQVDRVAIVAWPRQSSSLDDMWVWCEEYRPEIAQEGLARVDRLAAWAQQQTVNGLSPMKTAMLASHDASDCRYCPWHAPKDSGRNFGCNGK